MYGKYCLVFVLFFLIVPCHAKKHAIHAHDFVEITKINPTIRTEVLYATKNNFTRQKLYNSPRCFARRLVAQKLDLVQKDLAQKKLGLKIWDAYRPLSVQKKMWAICPDEKYVANPAKGGRHARGTAIDLTLVSLVDGKELEMPTAFDDFSPRAHPDYVNGVSDMAIKNRAILASAMLKHGFQKHGSEWWHFDFAGWRNCQPMDISLERLGKGK